MLCFLGVPPVTHIRLLGDVFGLVEVAELHGERVIFAYLILLDFFQRMGIHSFDILLGEYLVGDVVVLLPQ